MANADDVRRLALALPGVVEIESDGFDFRVAGTPVSPARPTASRPRNRADRADQAPGHLTLPAASCGAARTRHKHRLPVLLPRQDGRLNWLASRMPGSFTRYAPADRVLNCSA